MAKPGSPSETYERNTWPELERLARDLPEAGVHFQDTVIYRRAKDAGTDIANWFAELMREDAWFKDVVPNVGLHYLFPFPSHPTNHMNITQRDTHEFVVPRPT